MARRHLVNLLKLVLVAALMAFVFTNVQWTDARIEHGPDGSEVVEPGAIVGPWDGPEVSFRPYDEAGHLRPAEVVVPDPPRVVMSPGFPTYVANLDWLPFALGALCYGLTIVFSSSRWWWLLLVNRLRVSWFEALRFTWIGLFFNNVVPGQTGGDVVKAIYIVKHCPGGRVPALVSVLVDRVLGLGSLALLGAIVVLFALDRPGFAALALGIWAVLGLVALIGVVAFSKRLRRLIHLDDLLNRLPLKLSGVLKRIDRAVYFYRAHKLGIGLWVLAGIVNHIASVASVLLVGEALHVGMPALEYFVLVPVITTASALPLAPNGWGIGETLYRQLFAEFGAESLIDVRPATAKFIMGTRGVALSVLYRIHLTLWSLVGGALLLVGRDRVTRADIEREVARGDDEALDLGGAAAAGEPGREMG